MAQRKGGSKVAVEVEAVRRARLTPAEEQVVRMTSGSSLPRSAPLAKKATGDALDELHLIELELFRRYRAHLAAQKAAAPARAKIVSKLKK